VRVRFEVPAAAAPLAQTGAFVLPGDKGIAERRFETLADAVHAASHGDTIEIRGNGPFVTVPIKIDLPALTIRAGVGFVPLLELSREEAPRGAALLESSGLVNLEGLDLRLHGFDPRRDVRCLNCLGVGRLHLANCRLLANPPAKAIFATHNARVTIRNSQATNALILSHASRFLAQNDILASSQTVLEVTDGSLRLDHNTLVGKLLLAIRDDIAADDPGELARRLDCEVVANILGARGMVLSYAPWSGPRGHPQGQAAPPIEPLLIALQRRVNWIDSRNAYTAEAPLIGLFINPTTKVTTTSLADWHEFWRQMDATGNLQGSCRFAGGDVFLQSADSPERLSPEDFRLAAESAGYRAGEGGKDLGAEIDLVGPGAAYERWKKTPEYQEWLKETGQVN